MNINRKTSDSLLQLVRSAILEAGIEAMNWFGDRDISISSKADGSPVSIADIKINQILFTRLCEGFPSAAWLSEESKDNLNRLGSDWVWIVDPLDGTKEFTKSIPQFAISIGLTYKQQPYLGAVYNPATHEGGVGFAEGPSFFWGNSTRTNLPANLSSSTVSISRTEVEDGSIVPHLELFKEARPIGSVAYKLLRVATGAENLTFSVQPKSEWDVCGGIALLRSQKMDYYRFDKNPVKFNQRHTRINSGAVAGNPHLSSQLLGQFEKNPEFSTVFNSRAQHHGHDVSNTKYVQGCAPR